MRGVVRVDGVSLAFHAFSATRYHEGSDFHAGVPITSSNVDKCRGCWTAYMTLALTGVDICSEVTEEVVLGDPGKAF
jgi:hypothetical protein